MSAWSGFSMVVLSEFGQRVWLWCVLLSLDSTHRNLFNYDTGVRESDERAAPVVRGIRPVVVAICSAFSAYEGFVSQAPVIEF
jgi:hypothetical protein